MIISNELWARVPVNEKGDPAFRTMEEVRTLLRDEQVVWLVNKALYQLGYQKAYHEKKRAERKEEHCEQ